MPIPIDTRMKPMDVKVHVSTGEGVEITWSDDHLSRYTFPYLRDHCPCALCKDEREKKESATTAIGGPSASSVLPMFKPRVTAKKASAVGSYAIQIEFSDAHATGIYSFEHLREICPCEDCAREFRGSAQEAAG
jgi:DUF971 family protein